MKKITILGVTGSVGGNALSVIAHAPGRFALEAVTAQDNIDGLIASALAHRPTLAVIGNTAHYAQLKDALAGSGVEVAAGQDAIVEAAARQADIVLAAIVGAAGLKPTLRALENGVTVALANKEALVAAGSVMLAQAQKSGARILPVDSEHSAIFQVLDAAQPVRKVTLTASGGPFRTWTAEQMAFATPEQAVQHPNWRMGAKISVDSATLMNKGLELIEAARLFPGVADKLDVLIHPESIVHGLVEYADGSVLAQLSPPDMRTPIACALSWPQRMDAPVEPLNLARLGQLTFEAPDEARFPALSLARAALAAGHSACAALNAANEVAVQAFLAGRIAFPAIAKTVEKTLRRVDTAPLHTLDDVLAVDNAARALAISLL